MRSSRPSSSRWAIIGPWTRSCGTSPSWATPLPSAPPATAWAAPATTSWTWPSPARSSTIASRTRSRRSRSTCSTSRPTRRAGWAKSASRPNWRPWTRRNAGWPRSRSRGCARASEMCSASGGDGEATPDLTGDAAVPVPAPAPAGVAVRTGLPLGARPARLPGGAGGRPVRHPYGPRLGELPPGRAAGPRRAGHRLRRGQAGLRHDQPNAGRLGGRSGQGRRHRGRLPGDGRRRSDRTCPGRPAPGFGRDQHQHERERGPGEPRAAASRQRPRRLRPDLPLWTTSTSTSPPTTPIPPRFGWRRSSCSTRSRTGSWPCKKRSRLWNRSTPTW